MNVVVRTGSNPRAVMRTARTAVAELTTDATAFTAAPLVLSLVALLACWIPARRATRVDPANVLKRD
jgi:ABC-type lipoprotein release transport system permease subunit